MQKTEKIYRGSQLVEFYDFDNAVTIDDIQKIIDILSSNGVAFRGFRLSNSLEQPEHFHRTFYSLKDFKMFPWSENIYIDDFGMFCIYQNKKIDLTFDLSRNIVITFSDGKIDLEPILIAIEEGIKKKTR